MAEALTELGHRRLPEQLRGVVACAADAGARAVSRLPTKQGDGLHAWGGSRLPWPIGLSLFLRHFFASNTLDEVCSPPVQRAEGGRRTGRAPRPMAQAQGLSFPIAPGLLTSRSGVSVCRAGCGSSALACWRPAPP